MEQDYDDKIMNEIVTPEYPTDPLELLGERNFSEPREVPADEIGTKVQEFYRDSIIFLTGATGFIGYVLLDKLLRSCPHIKLIYVLIRSKKGKSPQERLEQIFDNRLYKRLKHEVPGFMKKLVVISGDLEEPDLGISEADRRILVNEVNIICHCGANVRFDEKLVRAIKNKVYSTQDILKLAKECKKLKTLVYISTAYSFCTEKQVEEKISPMPVHYKSVLKTISSIDEKELNSRESEFLMGWPNTYTFSKAIAESVIVEEGQGLPVAVFRPSIVISSYREPVKGWVNNYYGPIGIIAGIRSGILHVYPDNISNPFLNTVPVDFTVNALICAAKDTAEMFQSTDPKEFKIPVYNYANVESNIPLWQVLQIQDAKASWEWPTVYAVWCYFTLFIPNNLMFLLYSFFLHRIPGYIFDAVLICCGRKPLLRDTYKKYHSTVLNTLKYFITKRWLFETKRVQNLWNNLSLEDRELFFFNLAEISWEEHCRTGTLGMRVYLFKDDIHTLPKARKYYRRLYYAHTILKYVFYGTLFLISVKLYNSIFFY